MKLAYSQTNFAVNVVSDQKYGALWNKSRGHDKDDEFLMINYTHWRLKLGYFPIEPLSQQPKHIPYLYQFMEIVINITYPNMTTPLLILTNNHNTGKWCINL